MTVQDRTVVTTSKRIPRVDLRGTKGTVLIMITTLAVLTTIIALTAGGYWLSIFTSSFAIALAAAGTGLLYGRLGLISLCQFALVGIGGWITLRVYHLFHPPFEICLAAGGLGAGLIGVLWGLPAIRMRGLYLALATLMLAGGFQVLIANWSFPNGGTGLLGHMGDRPRIDMERPPIASSDVGYFIYVAVVLALGLALLEWHRHAKPGRAWALISRSEAMAEASGVRLVFYKTWAFALAGVLAGITGGLLAGCYGGMDGGAFTAADSLLLFAVAVIGGVGDWRGAVLAGLMFRVPPALLNYFGINGYIATMLFGAGLINTLVTAPTGIAGQIGSLIAGLKGRSDEGRSDDSY
jgi:branched-chain amino acid transport system permease protein